MSFPRSGHFVCAANGCYDQKKTIDFMAKLFKKDGVWYAEFYVRDSETGTFERQRKSTRIKVDGTAGAKKRAKIVADDLEHSGIDPAKRVVAKSVGPVLTDAYDARWKALMVRQAPKGSKQRAESTWRHLMRLIGHNTPCATITKTTLVDYAATRKTEGAAADTVRRELVELRTGLKDLEVPRPDMPSLPSPRVVQKWATAEEVEKICAFLPERRARMVRLIAQTGLRRNEVYALQRIAPGVGRLVGNEGLKTGERTIPLTATAEQILAEGPIEYWATASRDLGYAVKKAGLGRITFNDIRAGVATRLLIANVAPARIAALLGHTSLKQVEKRYARLRSLKVTVDDLAVLDPATIRPTEPLDVSSPILQNSSDGAESGLEGH